MNTEEHDDLWHLLGRARKRVPSPFFSRNILRAARAEKPETTSVFAWCRGNWLASALGACALIIAGLVLMPAPDRAEKSTIILAEKVSQSIDYQVIDNLDELIASEESLAWVEK